MTPTRSEREAVCSRCEGPWGEHVGTYDEPICPGWVCDGCGQHVTFMVDRDELEDWEKEAVLTLARRLGMEANPS